MLVATNILGHNTPAIAATEAQYGHMWAQDAVAMYGYASSSALATLLTAFTEPKQTTHLRRAPSSRRMTFVQGCGQLSSYR